MEMALSAGIHRISHEIFSLRTCKPGQFPYINCNAILLM